MPLASGANTIVCRAFDEHGVEQPEVGECNGGYLYNGWHRVQVQAQLHGS